MVGWLLQVLLLLEMLSAATAAVVGHPAGMEELTHWQPAGGRLDGGGGGGVWRWVVEIRRPMTGMAGS